MNVGMYAELPGDPQAAREARKLLCQFLGEDHRSADDASLILSELISNAITHTRSGQPGGTVIIAVEVIEQPSIVSISVRDAGADGAPVLSSPDSEGEHGRGLGIIAALASAWGSETSPTGHATWCRLAQGERDSSASDGQISPGRNAMKQADRVCNREAAQ